MSSISRGGQYILGYIVRGDTFSRGTLYPPTPVCAARARVRFTFALIRIRDCMNPVLMYAVGHCWSGKIQKHHPGILQQGLRRHDCVRSDRCGTVLKHAPLNNTCIYIYSGRSIHNVSAWVQSEA